LLSPAGPTRISPNLSGFFPLSPHSRGVQAGPLGVSHVAPPVYPAFSRGYPAKQVPPPPRFPFFLFPRRSVPSPGFTGFLVTACCSSCLFSAWHGPEGPLWWLNSGCLHLSDLFFLTFSVVFAVCHFSPPLLLSLFWAAVAPPTPETFLFPALFPSSIASSRCPGVF